MQYYLGAMTIGEIQLTWRFGRVELNKLCRLGSHYYRIRVLQAAGRLLLRSHTPIDPRDVRRPTRAELFTAR